MLINVYLHVASGEEELAKHTRVVQLSPQLCQTPNNPLAPIPGRLRCRRPQRVGAFPDFCLWVSFAEGRLEKKKKNQFLLSNNQQRRTWVVLGIAAEHGISIPSAATAAPCVADGPPAACPPPPSGLPRAPGIHKVQAGSPD